MSIGPATAPRLSGRVSRILHVLTGCTAVGKTELALRWAEARGAEIVSCDSLLFYRGMDIGTAKPTKAELARVPHHLINTRDVREPMDVAAYVSEVRAAVDGILGRGRAVLVTGGSGFYLKAFFGPVADDIAVPPEVREAVRARLAVEGLEGVRAELERVNPDGLGPLDVKNPRRVTRALERCLASGRTLADLQAEFAARPGPFADCEVRLCELVRPPEELDARIAARVGQMMDNGLVDEVRGLLDRGLRTNPSAAGAIGYRETIAVLEGRLPADALAAEIIRDTRALVKKQRTWFRTQLPAHRTAPAGSALPADLFA